MKVGEQLAETVHVAAYLLSMDRFSVCVVEFQLV